MKTLSNCPPLTTDNILTLKGQPITKMINPNQRKNALDLEEWIYYNVPAKAKEHYLFKKERLIGYKTELAN